MTTICVLLSTFNGEQFLREQLDTIINQKDVVVKILVRDDGSTDSTVTILNEYKEKGLLDWYTGENLRPAKSFMDLIYEAKLDCDFYALCDQDDYWLEDKLFIATEQMKKKGSDKPLLYYGVPRLVDCDLNPLEKPAEIYQKFTTYDSCLINSNATGCTMVFNKKLIILLKTAKPNFIAMHDAWIHKVCIALDGEVVFDEDVHILYRQHQNNVIGISTSKIKKLKRHYKSLKNKNCVRSRTVRSLLECYSDVMTADKVEKAKTIAYYKENFFLFIKLLFSHSIRTGYTKRDILFKIAVLLKIF